MPRLNPFITYLHDAYALLNLALMQHPFNQDNVGFLARSSAMHSVAALRSAANSCSKERGNSLLEKFNAYLRSTTRIGLQAADIAVLQELEMIEQMLGVPNSTQAHPFPQSQNERLIEFDRTPLKKVSTNVTHWIPEYSGASIGLVVSILNSLFFDRGKMNSREFANLFGIHFTGPSRARIAVVDEELADGLRFEQEILLENKEFVERMISDRWKFEVSDFRLSMPQ